MNRNQIMRATTHYSRWCSFLTTIPYNEEDFEKKYGDEIEPFMLRDEYEAALRRCGMKISNRMWLHKNQYLGGYLRTIPYNEAECEKEHGDKIKFVNATIPTTRCRARPIMMLNANY